MATDRPLALAQSPVAATVVTPVVFVLAKQGVVMGLSKLKLAALGTVAAVGVTFNVGPLVLPPAEGQGIGGGSAPGREPWRPEPSAPPLAASAPPAAAPTPPAAPKPPTVVRVTGATAPKWEYEFAAVPPSLADFQKLLTDKGEKGWEYAGTVTGGADDSKRPAGGRGAGSGSGMMSGSGGIGEAAPGRGAPGGPDGLPGGESGGRGGFSVGYGPDQSNATAKTVAIFKRPKPGEVKAADGFNPLALLGLPPGNGQGSTAYLPTVMGQTLAEVEKAKASARQAGETPPSVVITPPRHVSQTIYLRVVTLKKADEMLQKEMKGATLQIEYNSGRNSVTLHGPLSIVAKAKELVEVLDAETAVKTSAATEPADRSLVAPVPGRTDTSDIVLDLPDALKQGLDFEAIVADIVKSSQKPGGSQGRSAVVGGKLILIGVDEATAARIIKLIKPFDGNSSVKPRQ